MQKKEKAKSSIEIRNRVLKAREIQAQRYKELDINYNAQMGPKEIEKYCDLDSTCQQLIKKRHGKTKSLRSRLR